MAKKFLVSVIGAHKCDEKTLHLAEEIGKIIASSGAVLVTGGLGGVMEAASRGAKGVGGLTIGIIPGDEKKTSNPFIDIVIPTGMGYSRNALVAASGDIVVALPGEYGTLSEIAFALIDKKKVYGFGTWDIPGIRKLSSPESLKEILQRAIC